MYTEMWEALQIYCVIVGKNHREANTIHPSSLNLTWSNYPQFTGCFALFCFPGMYLKILIIQCCIFLGYHPNCSKHMTSWFYKAVKLGRKNWILVCKEWYTHSNTEQHFLFLLSSSVLLIEETMLKKQKCSVYEN